MNIVGEGTRSLTVKARPRRIAWRLWGRGRGWLERKGTLGWANQAAARLQKTITPSTASRALSMQSNLIAQNNEWNVDSQYA